MRSIPRLGIRRSCLTPLESFHCQTVCFRAETASASSLSARQQFKRFCSVRAVLPSISARTFSSNRCQTWTQNARGCPALLAECPMKLGRSAAAFRQAGIRTCAPRWMRNPLPGIHEAYRGRCVNTGPSLSGRGFAPSPPAAQSNVFQSVHARFHVIRVDVAQLHTGSRVNAQRLA